MNLSKKQKFILSDLARRAWLRSIAKAQPCHSPSPGGEGRDEGEIPVGAAANLTEDETGFRHRHVQLAVGKPGLRYCTQDDYKIVEAHFLDLLGRPGAALNALVDDHANPLRVAQFNLLEACRRAGVGLPYAAAICRKKFKCALDDASVSQIWKLKFDLDRAIRRRRGGESLTKPAQPRQPALV